MQQFTVPQFIDVEDKIIGPLTTRQFLIELTGFIIIGISYKFFDFTLFVTSGILIFAISGVFAFFKINGRPFHFFVLNFIQTLKRPPLRIWNHQINKVEAVFERDEIKSDNFIPAVTPKTYASSRLSELALIVDTKGVYKGEDNFNNK